MLMLDDLPPEVLGMICQALYEDCIPSDPAFLSIYSEESAVARHTLRELCLVSKRYRQIAQPMLWKSCGDSVMDRTMPPRLLKAVLDYPHLSRHIERVDLFPMVFNNAPEWEIDDPRVEATIRGFGVSFADNWIERLHQGPEQYGNGRQEAFAALFLAILPNLRRMRFCWPYDSNDILAELAAARDKFPGCKHLEDIAIYHGDTEGGWEFKTGVSLLTLPTLRRLTVGMIEETALYGLPRASLDLSVLNFAACALGIQSFDSLLAACKGVEEVYFEGAHITVLDPGSTDCMVPRQVVNSLKIHRKTLRKLTLDFEEFFRYVAEIMADMEDDLLMAVESLKDLDSLESLIIDQLCFSYDAGPMPGAREKVTQALVKKLPSSLKSLTIRRVNAVLTSAVEYFAAHCVTDFPNIRSFTLEADSSHIDAFEIYQELQNRFEGTTVKYQLQAEEYEATSEW